jgi:hypothetical protein
MLEHFSRPTTLGASHRVRSDHLLPPGATVAPPSHEATLRHSASLTLPDVKRRTHIPREHYRSNHLVLSYRLQLAA